jgi:3-methylfumaryl-CoA hydratase
MVETSETGTVVTDRIDPARAEALMATLGMVGQPPMVGEPLPPFFHHIYFWDAPGSDDLSADGHRTTDDPRGQRMWAGGRLNFLGDFRAGVSAKKTTSVKDISEKQGRSGMLRFVTLNHIIQQRGETVLTEDQVIVYRDQSLAVAQPDATQRRVADFRLPLDFEETTLFRYSALMFNAHRIHYDADYCRTVAGYPGLVVHGPLLAQFLVLLAAERSGPLASFTYRSHAPLFLGDSISLCANGQDFWVEGNEGQVSMTAAARPRS